MLQVIAGTIRYRASSKGINNYPAITLLLFVYGLLNLIDQNNEPDLECMGVCFQTGSARFAILTARICW